MKEINFIEENNKLTTMCLSNNCMVGSRMCTKCKHFVSCDFKEKVVKCNNNKVEIDSFYKNKNDAHLFIKYDDSKDLTLTFTKILLVILLLIFIFGFRSCYNSNPSTIILKDGHEYYKYSTGWDFKNYQYIHSDKCKKCKSLK